MEERQLQSTNAVRGVVDLCFARDTKKLRVKQMVFAHTQRPDAHAWILPHGSWPATKKKTIVGEGRGR